jgi:uncharacterized membrane protein YjfL (UPF0719 family)
MMPFLLKVAETIGWSIIGVLIVYGSLQLFDRLDPIDFRQEIRNGNLAAGMVVGALVLAVAAIVVTVLLSP